MSTDYSQILEFVSKHIQDDPLKLRLKHHNDSSFILNAITQIECRQRYGKKLSETLSRFDGFLFADTLSGEQCTSDVISSAHARIVGDDVTTLVDFTAGLGIDDFHLAQVCDSVTSVEIDKSRAEILAYNAEGLGLSNINVLCGNSIDMLKDGKLSGDVAYIDPARRNNEGGRVYAMHDCQPNLIEIMPLLHKHFSRLVAKISPMADFSAVENSLGVGITDIYAIGNRTECKEVVVDMLLNPDAQSLQRGITRHAYTIQDKGVCDIAFTVSEENSLPPAPTGKPRIGEFIYEPWPTVLKAGALRMLAHKYNLLKPHPNTHIYFSETYLPDVPADIRRIIDIIPWQSKHIKRLSEKYPNTEVAVRNFGMTADVLRKKLGVKPSDKFRLVAFTDASGNKQMIVSERL